MPCRPPCESFFFFNDTATTEIYTLSLHDALPIWPMVPTPPGVTMLPSEMALRPDVTPFLPATDEPLPNADSNEVLRLEDGDIIDLDAELVRRTINGQTYTMYSYNEIGRAHV